MKKIPAIIATLSISILGLGRAGEICIVPKPVQLRVETGVFHLSAQTTVWEAPDFRETGLARTLANYLAPATGFALRVKTGPAPTRGILLEKTGPDPVLGQEGYRLEATPDRVRISAPASAGVFYGIQTLRQLLPPAIFAPVKQSGVAWDVPCVKILDYPRFRWRGLHMDVSRHFFHAAYVKRFIDLLAMHKMNTFHWHLCDDDGWRIEIKEYPDLTAKGSSRSRTINYGKPTFYTQAQIRDVVRYALQRHVNIVPEIEIPGHEAAAIRAYPEFGARDRRGRLGNVFNIRDKTVQALKNILGEVTDLFPGPFVHCGGDEVWASWVWRVDPESAAKAKRLGLRTPRQIQTWLMNQMADFLASKGRRMVGWGEIAGNKLRKDVVVMAWRGTGRTGILSARKGFDVVMAPGAYTYFDHRQAPDERGFGGAVLTLARVYSFDPAFPGQLDAAARRHILGVQGQLWTEMIPTEKRMDYMAWPRGCALAEVGWTPQRERSFADFAKRLRLHLARLDALHVNYRLPVKVRIEEKDGALELSAPAGFGTIHYTLDGTRPGPKSPVYRKPIPIRGIGRLQAALVRPDGRVGPVAVYVGVVTPPLRADACTIHGGMRIEQLIRGRKSIGGWGNPRGTLTWRVRFDKAGRYKVSGLFSDTAPAQMKLVVGGETVRFLIPRLKGWYKPVRVPIGTVRIPTPGVYPVTLAVAARRGYRGINMWQIDFERE